MSERCSHAQCSAPATARVAFDSLACFVWIDPYEAAGPRDVGARGAGALCTRHADRLVAPRGWAVQDRRSAEPPLWSERPAREEPEPPRPARRDRPTEPSAAPAATATVVAIDAPLPFDADPEPAPAAASTASPAHVVAHQPAPERDDIEDLLARPTSPLLSRAFDRARGGHLD